MISEQMKKLYRRYDKNIKENAKASIGFEHRLFVEEKMPNIFVISSKECVKTSKDEGQTLIKETVENLKISDANKQELITIINDIYLYDFSYDKRKKELERTLSFYCLENSLFVLGEILRAYLAMGKNQKHDIENQSPGNTVCILCPNDMEIK